MNAKRIFMTALTVSAFSLAPMAFAEEGSQKSGSDVKSTTQQKSSESSTSEHKTTIESSKSSQEQAQTKTQKSDILKASTMIGSTVKNPQGQNLGEIEELVIDPDNGRVAYAVLSFGSALGMGDKLFAIPWGALKPMSDQQSFSLDVNKEKLQKAPGFDKDNWPDLADRNWGVVVYRFYDLDPYW